ncbi:MAG: hypothetical protein RL021_164 [Bacteroidota bacterium]
MTLSFVGAGVMPLRNAMAVVLGSNFGTTLDSWVIALLGFRFDIDALAYPVLAVSLVGLLFFGRRTALKSWSEFLVSFALLFIGLAYMKASLSAENMLALFTRFSGYNPYVFVFVGFIVTGIIQSSFAMMAILLSALHAHAIPLEHAAAAVVGSEIGTAIKLLFGSVSGSADKRRFAWGNFVFNVLSTVAGAVLLFPLVKLIRDFLFPDDPLMTLVAFQSVVNLISVVLCYPFLGRFAELLERFIRPGRPGPFEGGFSSEDLYSDDRLQLVREGAIDLFHRTVLLNRKALGISVDQKRRRSGFAERFKKWSRAVPFIEDYRQLKQQQGELLETCADLLREELTLEETDRLNRLVAALRNCVHAAKSLKDIRHNLKELSDSANDRLFGLLSQLRDREDAFYQLLEAGENGSESELNRRLQANKTELERMTANTLTLLQEHDIKEYEASTLMNVYREIYSSHKSLLKARGEVMGN